jgi:hypothetical protein
MSSSVAPSLAVSGDVGILAEENAQRLVSIFTEDGTLMLLKMTDIVKKDLQAKGGNMANFDRLYKKLLSSIGEWSSEMLQKEVSDMEAMYPEIKMLHQFVYVNVMSEAAYATCTRNLVVPSLVEVYHAFLKRLVASLDVQKGAQFLELPLSHRRVVFLDAFRNAYHDLARRSCSAQAVVVTALPQPSQRTASHRTVASSDRMELQTKPSSAASSATSEAPKSRLAQAMLEAQATAPSRAASGPMEAAPPAEQNSKNVLLLDSPAFFEEEKSMPAEAAA